MSEPSAQNRGDGQRSLVTLERVLSEYNKDLIFDLIFNFYFYIKRKQGCSYPFDKSTFA